MQSPNPIQLRKYDKIDVETRKRLVQEVIQDERSISKTANKYGIKLSTAKDIVRRFKRTGTFFESKREKQIRAAQSQRVSQSISLPDLQGLPMEVSYLTPNNWGGLIFPQTGLYLPIPLMEMGWPVYWQNYI